ncbi:AAA family ATPase [Coleofasciculus sp. E1-EBD-02]|uniref:AAA family ATPase n=1 Tax=Coleofasciculus sp. E1-EBD-02 TaxID=3068481 RepID=UPI0032F0BAD8
MTIHPNFILAGYQVITQVYESANSLVYRGIREQDQQGVILKVLKQNYPTPSELTRYKQEYEITRNLNIDGVVKAYDIQPYQRTLVIVLEDFGASSLKQLMNDSAGAHVGATLWEFLDIAIKTTEIVGQIHSSNVIHKNINPANIVFNRETGQLKIIDFGISTQLNRENPTPKNPNVLEGTLAYISPEQTGRMNRTLDYRTDFYSLGVTFYELLTGKLPFETTDALELVHCHIAKQPVSPHELVGATHESFLPTIVSDIVMKLMAKTAEERYQSGWGIKADLEECLHQLQTTGGIFSFPLGTQDISDKFQIPQKLYGREAEVETLLKAFDRVADNPQSQIEMMLVAGYSGIGKSSLVAEIHKPNTRLRGYFTEGKFDQFQRNIPYSAIVSALKGLMRQLLTESEAQLTQWREKLLAAVGSNGQVIIDVIPEVELIVGKQPPVPELGLTESQNRFNLVFSQFIRAFCTKEHPLVIFLDDLQWADSATLKLIELMMTDNETQYLVLMGAYRDNEVNPTHPLMMTLDGLKKQGAIVNSITLAPLELESISQLIADTLHSDTDEVKPLAELVREKTDGNPFFANQFLKTLHAENLITFNLQGYCWQWDLEQIEAQNITENVVELMIGKLKKLPEATQEVLRLAACIGASFDLTTSSIICEKSKEDVSSYLVTAIQSGFILPTSELDTELLIHDYKFLHDRVQQAAYALIDEAEKQAINLQIGRLLLQNTDAETLSEEIFKIVDHLNLGTELVSHQAERDKIAELNLMAGKKAKAATAYQAAIKYLNTGLNLLSADSWQSKYELTLSLYEEATEAAYLNSDFDRTDKLIKLARKNAKTILDEVKFCEIEIQVYAAQDKPLEAVKTSLSILALLGIEFPQQPSELDFQKGLGEITSNLAGQQIEDLINLPQMTSSEKLSAMRIFSISHISFYCSVPELFPLIIMKQVSLSIQYGNTPESSVSYANYGLILCGIIKDIDSGYRFGQLALGLLERFNAKKLKAKVIFLVNVWINHWKKHPRKILQNFLNAYSSGLEMGDVESAALSAFLHSYTSFFIGNELSKLEQEMNLFRDSIAQMNQEFPLSMHNIYHQIVINLIDIDKKAVFSRGNIDNKFLDFSEKADNRTTLCHLFSNKLIVCYLFDRPREALQNAVETEKYIDSLISTMTESVFCFYDSLVHLSLYKDASNSDRKNILDKVIANQEKMKLWAHHAPMNNLHKFHLVEAEKARVLGQFFEAEEFYEQAIAGARENEFIQEEALAYELAAKFYLERGREKFAQTYMKEAHYAYTRWGAKAKVEDLEAKYPQLLTKSSSTKSITSTTTTTIASTSGSQSGEALDLASVMKASQAISGEIRLDKLLTKLITILLENTGAQSGFLLLETKGELFIETEARANGEVTVLQAMPLEFVKPNGEMPLLSSAIINYVVRTRKSLVLDDAMHKGNFTNERYIKKYGVKSVLCVPLLNQGQLSGIVYLENNLTTGAFTPDRLEVLQLLSGQAAIAITNAKLYTEVKQSERRLTQYLEAMPVGVSVHTSTGQLHYANQKAQELLGFRCHVEAETEQIAEAYQVYCAGTQELYPNEQIPVVRSLAGETVKVDDLELQQLDKRLPLEVSSTPIFDETGKISYAIAAFQDITERKQAEKLIAEYNRTLETQVAERTQALAQALEEVKTIQDELIQKEKMAALGQLIAGIAHEINTPLGAIRSSAGNIAKFLDQTLEQLPTLFQSLSTEDSASFLALLQRSLQHQSTFSTKEERKFKRALRRELENSDIHDADIIAERLVIMGITDEIASLMPLLQRSDSFQILEIAYKLSELKRGTATINTSTDRASKVVFALKTYSRYDQAEEKIIVNLTDGIETVLTLYHNQLKQGVKVIRNYTDIPPVSCYADELNQVWTNLIHNALQAMDNRGTLTIEVTQVNQEAKISITDSGSGIPEEIKSKIFEPFFTTKPAGEGSGLGLDIVKKIIDKHSGHLTVESQLGRTTFNVFLPIQS